MFCKNILESSGFLPKEIAKIKSSENGEIKVIEKGGKKSIIVSGLSQSGPQIESLWKKVLSRIKIKPQEILILGLGGGSLVNLLLKKWSNVIIEAVEIDPQMIKISQDYFGVSQEKAIVILGDATKVVKTQKFKNRLFELIFVDLYLGEKYPKEAESDDFLTSLKKLVEEDGIIIFNRLYFGGHKKKAEIFKAKLEKFFADVKSYKSELFFPSNLLIFCKK